MNLWKKTAVGLVSIGVAGTTGFVFSDEFDRYEDPAEKGSIEIMLQALRPEDKDPMKAHLIAGVGAEIKSFKQDGITVVIHSVQRNNNMVVVDLEAHRGGEKLTLDTPFQFVNPPVKVETGKYHRELINGVEEDVVNYEENPS